MSSKAMSLKAKIRNYAKDNRIAAQVVLQNYMFERFLARLSQSDYRDKFVIRVGILERIAESKDLQAMWLKYQKRFSYAGDIEYADIINALRELLL